jgi:chromate transporter
MNLSTIERAGSGRIAEQPAQHPGFGDAFRFWLKLGFISFGGPTGQIAIMHAELVEKKRWISEARFLHALNYCMLLPGPEAQQLATYVGWLLHKTWGGVVAGALFVIPSMFILWALSFVYVTFGTVSWVAAIFYGLKPAVLAIVAAAVIRIGSKALKNAVMWTLAALAFIAIYFFKVPFPIIILVAAIIGLIGGKFRRDKFLVIGGHGPKAGASGATVIDDNATAAEHTRPTFARALKVCAVWLSLWWIPIAVLALWLGPNHTLFREAIFFSKAAMVTFGGAYAVLPYVSQQAVETHHWLTAPQMLDGLGLAETTPGPLIMVLQFVGFLGGWNQPGALPPLLAATLGAFITTWTTFIPCFLWIFLGAPHIEQLRGNERLTTALSAVTAAVVGVILNLAVWFSVHVLLPRERAVDWFAAGIAVVAFIGMVRWKWDVIPIVLGAGVFGLLYKTLL